jgi:hypothetical protein
VGEIYLDRPSQVSLQRRCFREEFEPWEDLRLRVRSRILFGSGFNMGARNEDKQVHSDWLIALFGQMYNMPISSLCCAVLYPLTCMPVGLYHDPALDRCECLSQTLSVITKVVTTCLVPSLISLPSFIFLCRVRGRWDISSYQGQCVVGV